MNQPLSVQPWGRDGEKRRYWLIEGRDDTPFRLYRESNPALKTHHTWRSVAGSIEELQAVAKKLDEDGTQHAKRLSQRITNAIPRFEATEEVCPLHHYQPEHVSLFYRSASVVNTVRLARHNLHALSRAFQCMRDGRVVSG
jgi:hypothetical protein